MGRELKHYHAARVILGGYGVSQDEFNQLNEFELGQYLKAIEELETARRQQLALQFLSFFSATRPKTQTKPSSTSHTHTNTRVVHSLRRRPVGDKK